MTWADTRATWSGGRAGAAAGLPQQAGDVGREAVAAVPALGRDQGQVRRQVLGPHAYQVAGGGRGRDLLGVAADARSDDCHEQGVSGGEVAEDRAAADVRRLGHVVDGRGQAARGERVCHT
jgi:hypothetical protein